MRRGRLPPAASRPTPRTAPCQCSPFDSRQGAGAFNQPLNWDTSKVTSMRFMFDVRSSPCPDPCVQSDPPLHAACAAVARRLPHLPRTAPYAPEYAPPPPLRLSAARVRVQSAAELGPLQPHRDWLHVLCALLPVPSDPYCTRALPRTLHSPRVLPASPPPSSQAASRPAPYTLLSTLGSTQTPCPTTTSG